MDYYVLNPDHTTRRATMEEFISLWKNGPDSRVAQEHIIADDGTKVAWVSTVFLGMNHNYFGDEPLLFETMIFADDLEDIAGYTERYATWEEAEAGHARAVAAAKEHFGIQLKIGHVQ